MSDEISDDLADRIYEASVLPELWQDVLKRFAVVAQSTIAGMYAGKGSSFHWIGSDDLADRIAARAFTYPGTAEQSRRLIALQRPAFTTERDIMSDEEIASDPLTNEVVKPNRLGRWLATAVQLPDNMHVIFYALGDQAHGPHRPETFRACDALRPHLARASLISARLAFERARTAVNALERLGLAACAVRANATVLETNAAFASETTIWTTRGNDRLILHDRHANGLLSDALERLDTHDSVRSIPLRAGPGKAPAVLHVVPIRRGARDVFSGSAAILVLTRPTGHGVEATPLLQTLFDLTPTEANIALRVGGGMTLAEIAAADGKSLDTVRNQLKATLAKTGCSRQVDLAHLLARILLPSR